MTVGTIGQWSEYLQLKQEAVGLIASGWLEVSYSWLTNVDGMKESMVL